MLVDSGGCRLTSHRSFFITPQEAQVEDADWFLKDGPRKDVPDNSKRGCDGRSPPCWTAGPLQNSLHRLSGKRRTRTTADFL